MDAWSRVLFSSLYVRTYYQITSDDYSLSDWKLPKVKSAKTMKAQINQFHT